MTKLKILCIGDPHIKIDNLAEFKEFEIKLIELIEKENPNFIVCLGDILHTHERLHTIPLNKAYSFIDNIRKFCPLYLIVGNHDYIHNQEFLSENHWMNSLKEWKNVFVIDKVKELKIDKRNFVFVPYVFPGKFGEALSTINNNIWKKSDIIFAHQEIKGCKMGPIQSTEGDEWNLEYPQIISGHIHSNKKPQKNVYYPGSALQNAFGESEKNIIPIIEYEEKGEFFLREIDLLLPRKKIISCDIKNIDQIKINENTKDKLRITLKGDYDDFKSLKKTSKYKELVEKGIKIVFRNNVEKTPIENKEHNKHEEKNIVEKSFSEILRELILKEENKKLYCLYEKIINNNEILVL